MDEEKEDALRSNELAKATAEANEIFAKLAQVVEARVKEGVTEIDLIEDARAAGLKLDDATLKELQIDRIILCHPWLPWHFWYPWRPIWCWWWHRYYPWYRCCPWWWHRCHWHPHHH